MGSSKKHKEKRERKKHKKGRSRSRERDSHKKSHKSKKDKRKSPERVARENSDERKRFNLEEEASYHDYRHEEVKSPMRYREPSPDDDFDIDKLLDSKLSEKFEIQPVKRTSKRRIREEVLEELKKRQNLISNEAPIKLTHEQHVEGIGEPSIKSRSPEQKSPRQEPVGIPFITDVTIKEEPPDDYVTEDPFEERPEPQLSLSINDTNKLRAKLGLKPLEIERELPKRPEPQLSLSIGETNKLKAKHSLKSLESERDMPERPEPQLSLSIGEANKLRAKRGLKSLEIKREMPERPEPQLFLSITETNKLRAKRGLQPLEVEREIPERPEPQLSLSITETNKLRAKRGLQPLEVEREIPERPEPQLSLSITETNKLRAKRGLKLLEVEREIPERPEPQLSLSISETNKLREKRGLKPLDVEKELPERLEPQPSLSISEANKLRAKRGLKSLEVEKEMPERPEPQQSVSSSETSKLRGKRGVKHSEIESEVAERTEPQLSLSISEANKLRAKLGLKPLNVGNDVPGISDENAEKEPSKPVEVFVKTENISEIKRSEALREKLKVMKEKRAVEEKLRKTKGIADSDSEEESAASWVIKHQKLLQEKERADKRAKMLEEMDEEFGVGAIVEAEFHKNKAYTSQHLKGLTIGHDVGAFKEGTPIILTLKDKGVLEEEDDVLENINIKDNERYAKNVEVKKKKPDYQAFEEPEFDEFGILKKKNLLSKYDEEIEGEKKKSFKIGTNVISSSSTHSTREQELELIRMKLKQQNKISLEMPELKVVNEYYTHEDMVQFKKPKKRKKEKKLRILKADDLLPDESDRDLGSRKKKKILDDVPYSTDTIEMEVPVFDQDMMSNVLIEEDQAEKELYSALNKAKKLKQRKIMSTAPEKVMEIMSKTSASGSDSAADLKGANIELNSVAEFCRTLGEIPTYGMSGNRDEEADEMMDLERELLEEKQKQELEAQNRGAWNEVDIDEKPAEISVRENEPILEEEPDINLGVAGALKLATKKGYLDKDGKKLSNAPKSSQLQAQSYTIEEKFYEDDKFGKRDRYSGPIQEFREKSNYKPDVKLEYIDDSGRLLTAKEAFRYLSHKFHGKGPGKNKVDKRMKKLEQDTRLKQMSSTDTPLNTVKLLQAKQKETQSPYIVLSGGNKTLTQTMISKTKM